MFNLQKKETQQRISIINRRLALLESEQKKAALKKLLSDAKLKDINDYLEFLEIRVDTLEKYLGIGHGFRKLKTWLILYLVQDLSCVFCNIFTKGFIRGDSCQFHGS